MELDLTTCRRASVARDARFDGRFFVGVTSTGIYCRPICPARTPLERNVRYFPSAAAASGAGLRPCLRCRPEASPGTPAWAGTTTTVSRALALIAAGALDEGDVEPMAERLGVTGRHLRRLFIEHLGAPPHAVAVTRRVHFAKRLIDETNVPFTEVAAASGFGSVRRFNGTLRALYARTPTELRRLARRAPGTDERGVTLTLSYRPPLDWHALLGFLRGRATPGVEVVGDGVYRRTFVASGARGDLEVRLAPAGDSLLASIRVGDPRALLSIVERTRRLFDLGAVPEAIADHLGRDALLRRAMRRHPGLRVPGAWDPLEVVVRAILGQQVSVKAATTLAGRLAGRWGEPYAAGEGLSRLFPDAATLASAPIEEVGVVSARAEAIRAVAREVADGSLVLDGAARDLPSLVMRLRAFRGIGEWTAQYVAMRAFGEPDAFPAGDLVLRRAAGVKTESEMVKRAEAWRPWRAYAAMLLWQGARDE